MLCMCICIYLSSLLLVVYVPSACSDASFLTGCNCSFLRSNHFYLFIFFILLFFCNHFYFSYPSLYFNVSATTFTFFQLFSFTCQQKKLKQSFLTFQQSLLLFSYDFHFFQAINFSFLAITLTLSAITFNFCINFHFIQQSL